MVEDGERQPHWEVKDFNALFFLFLSLLQTVWIDSLNLFEFPSPIMRSSLVTPEQVETVVICLGPH
jgi:hypothetical protein